MGIFLDAMLGGEVLESLGGDFKVVVFRSGPRTLTLQAQDGSRAKGPVVDLVETVEEISAEESGMGAAAGWGVAGAVVAGPVGALAGALLGGSSKKIIVGIKFKDGRRFVTRTTPTIYAELRSCVF